MQRRTARQRSLCRLVLRTLSHSGICDATVEQPTPLITVATWCKLAQRSMRVTDFSPLTAFQTKKWHLHVECGIRNNQGSMRIFKVFSNCRWRSVTRCCVTSKCPEQQFLWMTVWRNEGLDPMREARTLRAPQPELYFDRFTRTGPCEERDCFDFIHGVYRNLLISKFTRHLKPVYRQSKLPG